MALRGGRFLFLLLLLASLAVSDEPTSPTAEEKADDDVSTTTEPAAAPTEPATVDSTTGEPPNSTNTTADPSTEIVATIDPCDELASNVTVKSNVTVMNCTANSTEADNSTTTIEVSTTTVTEEPTTTTQQRDINGNENTWAPLKPSAYSKSIEPAQHFAFMSLKDLKRSPLIQQKEMDTSLFGMLIAAIVIYGLVFLATPLLAFKHPARIQPTGKELLSTTQTTATGAEETPNKATQSSVEPPTNPT